MPRLAANVERFDDLIRRGIDARDLGVSLAGGPHRRVVATDSLRLVPNVDVRQDLTCLRIDPRNLVDLEKRHPGIKDRLIDTKGVRRFINIYVGEEDVRFLEGLATPVKTGDQISIIPAIAGG